MTTALALTGGGARGAYQAGAIGELLPALAADGRHPSVLSGASVGALNAAALAATAHLAVRDQVSALAAMWRDVRQRDVLPPFVAQAPRVLLSYLNELTPLPGPRLRGLVATGRLRGSVERWVDLARLHANVGERKPVATLMIMATEVVSGEATAFVAGRTPVGDDGRLRWVPTRLGADHLVASASIPLLFEATRVDEPREAAGWYCDGSTRLGRPVTPILDAGADDLVVVSTTSLAPARGRPDPSAEHEPDLADVAVNVLDALVRDVLVDDLERCRRRAPCLVVAPEDPHAIGRLAREVVDAKYRRPTGLLRSDFPLIDWALGSRSPRQSELLSYLLFDPDFIAGAMALGAADARRALERSAGPT
jgi:NTE family protein